MATNKFILTDGQKAVSLTGSEGWTYFSGEPMRDSDKLYSMVAAAYRAYNLKANTVGNMPFCLYKGKTEFDNSATWENKVGFLPAPSELFRLNTLSYMDSNQIYNMRGMNATMDITRAERTKSLIHAVSRTFRPYTHPVTGALEYIERDVNGKVERYAPDDKRLVRMWRLDHTTEVLPSPYTEAKAIMNAAGIQYHADTWIQHFFANGGIVPMVIAMKGMVPNEKKESEARSWHDWYLGLREKLRSRFRVINADALDVKQVGSGIGELKDNVTYQQALANIAMGTGMPLSLLMANSANYATAKEEKATWYENDIIPLCNWMAYEYNRQVFEPLGLRMEFHPETLDPQQEDETERAQALNQFMAFLNACPTYDVFIGATETFGYELSDNLVKAAEKFYTDKEKKAEEMQAQMGQAGVVLGPDGKPIPVQTKPGEDPEAEDDPKEEDKPEDDKEKKPFPPRKVWQPSVDELEEIRIYRKAALQRHKRAESLDFEYIPHGSGLPDDFMAQVKAKLLQATSDEDIRQAFVIAEDVTPAPEYKGVTTTADPGLMALAAAMNNLAEAEREKKG